MRIPQISELPMVVKVAPFLAMAACADPSQCESALLQSSAHPDFGLFLRDAIKTPDSNNDGVDEVLVTVIPDGIESVNVDCMVVPGDGIGEGWSTSVKERSNDGASPELEIAFEWNQEKHPTLNVWCYDGSMHGEEACTEHAVWYTEEDTGFADGQSYLSLPR
jgi:hypothetical protein